MVKLKAFYGDRFSKNMTKTPEGFLVCHNVPIARTGMYEYLGKEIGANDKADEIVKVYRSPEEVFNLAAIASFEGKTATDEHPSELITSDNNSLVDKGDVTNVRQGTGKESDLLLADLVIKDNILISEIEQGKREVSCGYDCVYEENEDGTYSQKQIRGNHVAIVQTGRAGNRVAIKDSNNKVLGGEKTMADKIVLPRKTSSLTKFFATIGLKQFVADAKPEEIMDAMEEMASETKESKDAEVETKPDDGEKKVQDAESGVESRLARIEAALEKLANAETKETKQEDSIDTMISELEKGTADDQGDEEESKTVPVEEMDEDLVNAPEAEEGDKAKNPLSTDSAAFIKTLKVMKPIIANMKDPAERKLAIDSLNAEFLKVKKGNGTDGYKNIAKAQKKKAAKAATDSALDAESRQAAIEKIYENIKLNHNAQSKGGK